MMWLVWLVIAVALAITELSSGDFTLLMLAGGATCGFVTALLLPGLIWAQVLVAALAAILLLWMLRPTLLKHMRRLPGYRSSVDQVIGATGAVTKDISIHGGEVKVLGQVWSAKSLTGTDIPVGVPIVVYEIDGTIAGVMPQGYPNSLPPAAPVDDPGDDAYWSRPE